MIQATYDDVTLKRLVKDNFGLEVAINAVILPLSDVGRTVQATVFLSQKSQLLVYITASSSMTLADIKQVASRMGLKIAKWFEPANQPGYFDIIGRQKFQKVFPNMKITSPDDLYFYRTLAPYNPALGVISEIKDGEIYQFDPDARGDWRVGARFAYRKVRPADA